MSRITMRTFLTEENISRHLEYMKKLKLQHSIMEKSIPELKSASPYSISKMNISKKLKREAADSLIKIKSHELYFDSFTNEFKRCSSLRALYGSEERFLYELLQISRSSDRGFLYIYLDERGRGRFVLEQDISRAFLCFEPMLALDLWEHSYFADYGFERDEYLKNAISHLDISRLEKK